MAKLSLKDLDLKGKRVLVRVDFNVPLDSLGRVGDDLRIRSSLPTIRHILSSGGSVILMSHLGRPKGKVVPEMRLGPVAESLSELLARPVRKMDDCVGEEVEKAASGLTPGEVMLLENLRFHPGETSNDPDFAVAILPGAWPFWETSMSTTLSAPATALTLRWMLCHGSFPEPPPVFCSRKNSTILVRSYGLPVAPSSPCWAGPRSRTRSG